MLIKTLPVGQLETNCYVVTDEDSLRCAVIDPGDESNTIMDYLEANRLSCGHIFITHGHFDHTGAAREVAGQTGAAVYMHKLDEGKDPFGGKDIGETLSYAEGDVIAVGGLELRVMETPGHTPGGVCLLCENAIFSGDTLFRDSCGRTDFPGGDMQTLMRSLRRLAALDGDYDVYPGHMDATTLDRERRFNYYMKYAAQEE